MLQSIFCLLAMWGLDEFQSALYEAEAQGDHKRYIEVYVRVQPDQLKFVRFYKYYYRLLPQVYRRFNSWSAGDRLSWVVDNPDDFDRLKELIDGFVYDRHRYAIYFDENPGEYDRLRVVALDIARLLTF